MTEPKEFGFDDMGIIKHDEWLQRFHKIMEQLGDRVKPTKAEIDELYTLHNDKFRPIQLDKHCTSCSAGVMRTMKNYKKRIDAVE